MSDQPSASPSILRRLRWKGILLGFIVDNGGSVACVTLIGIVVGIATGLDQDPERSQEAIMASAAFLTPILVVGSLFIVIGGFIAGRLAPRARLLNGAALGVLDVGLGLLFHSQVPLWFSITSLLLTMPCALFGAWLSKVVFPPSEVIPPPLPPAS